MNAKVPLPRHTLTPANFDSLASGAGDAAMMAEARRSERSWRLVSLRMLLELLRGTPESAGPIDVGASLELLIRAERADRCARNRVLDYPTTGIWVAHSLRRMRGTARSSTPLWIDIGHLSALSVAAALRAGIEFALEVPVRNGVLAIPTLGCLLLPGNDPWRTAMVRPIIKTNLVGIRVTSGDIDTTVADIGRDTADWMTVRELTARAEDLEIRIALDDVDPYREMVMPAEPRRLDPDRVDRLDKVLTGAWGLLVAGYPDYASAMAVTISMVCPLPAASKFRPHSASSDEAFGAIVLSEPDDAVQLGATLVHEFQHNKLGALQHLRVLVGKGDNSELLYAPWRDDPRPATGLLQGVYAFAGIADFWRRRRAHGTPQERRLAAFEYTLWRRQTLRTVRELGSRARLTESGARFLRLLEGRITEWQDSQVSEDVSRLVDLAARDHRAQWRAFHLRPEEADVQRIADAWLTGREIGMPPQPGRRISTDTAVHALDSRAVLMRCALLDDSPAQLRAEADAIAGIIDGDVDLVCGRPQAARRAYEKALCRRPDDIAALVGLGLALADTGDPAGQPILEMPEIVRAVCSAIGRQGGDIDVTALARRLVAG